MCVGARSSVRDVTVAVHIREVHISRMSGVNEHVTAQFARPQRSTTYKPCMGAFTCTHTWNPRSKIQDPVPYLHLVQNVLSLCGVVSCVLTDLSDLL